MHHRRAARVLATAAGLDVIAGLAFGWAQGTGPWTGLYWATTTATTVGYGDVTPHGWLPHVIAMIVYLTVIPLFASAFALVTTGLTADHIDVRHEQIKEHINGR